MVVASDDDVLLFDGSTPVEIPWDITHHNNGSNPTFDVTITIYNLAGSAVRTADENDDEDLGTVGIGEDSWSWDGKNDSNQTVDAGVYTYKVRAVHTAYYENCHDTDKSYRMPALNLSVTDIEQDGFDIPSLTLTLTVSYSVTTKDATDARVAIYDAALNKIAYKDVGPNEDGEVSAGYSGEVEFQLALDPDQMGVFSVVMFGRETSAGGAANRDGARKYGLQYVRTATLWPTACNTAGDGDYSGTFDSIVADAGSAQGTTAYDDTRYSVVYGPSTANATTTRANMRECSIFFYCGHGDPNVLLLRNIWPSDLIRGEGSAQDDDDASNRIFWIKNMGDEDLERCLFALFCGCKTAASDASGYDLLDAAAAKGVDCPAGFEETIYSNYAEEFCEDFWALTMDDGYYVDAAAVQAIVNLWNEHDDQDGGMASYASQGNVTLKPARWGN